MIIFNMEIQWERPTLNDSFFYHAQEIVVPVPHLSFFCNSRLGELGVQVNSPKWRPF